MKSSANATKTFRLLSIGQRGVGKTVFLVGSYTELHGDRPLPDSQKLWFDCQDREAKSNIAKILNYISENNQYPPPTMKITDFSFSLKQKTALGVQTLCNFIWSDIPGEICDSKNREFRRMVHESQRCCVFIDVYTLATDESYIKTIEDIMEQVTAIAHLAHLNDLKYPFAIILTKSDLVEADPPTRQKIEDCMRSLTSHLRFLRANYQNFYSFIPIVCTNGAFKLEPQGAASPFLWLVTELNKAYNPGLLKTLMQFTSLTAASNSHSESAAEGSIESVFKPAYKGGDGRSSGLMSVLSARKHLVIPAAILFLGLAGAGIFFLVNNDSTSSQRAQNPLSRVIAFRQNGELEKAIAELEKLVQQEPQKVEWQFQLADLYSRTAQFNKEESIYDRILAEYEKQPVRTQYEDYIRALLGKAQLRKSQGDLKTVEELFVKAEQAAPDEKLKAEIRELAEKMLERSPQPSLSPGPR
jgi:GTPase SAR1 family protein